MPIMLDETKICDLEDQCPGASKDAEEYYVADHPEQKEVSHAPTLFENPFRYVNFDDLLVPLFFVWLLFCIFSK